jgi:hypothetical protein
MCHRLLVISRLRGVPLRHCREVRPERSCEQGKQHPEETSFGAA